MIHVLLVCSANVCRSRMAEVRLLGEAERRHVDVSVSSAGILQGGLEVPNEVMDALAELGSPPHLLERLSTPGRELQPEDAAGADLIVCMQRLHVRHVVVLDPSSWIRTFTLKELVRASNTVGPRGSGEPLETWLAEVGEGRQVSDLLGDSDRDDVADPYGGSPREYARAAEEIAGLVAVLADLLWPDSPGPGPETP